MFPFVRTLSGKKDSISKESTTPVRKSHSLSDTLLSSYLNKDDIQADVAAVSSMNLVEDYFLPSASTLHSPIVGTNFKRNSKGTSSSASSSPAITVANNFSIASPVLAINPPSPKQRSSRLSIAVDEFSIPISNDSNSKRLSSSSSSSEGMITILFQITVIVHEADQLPEIEAGFKGIATPFVEVKCACEKGASSATNNSINQAIRLVTGSTNNYNNKTQVCKTRRRGLTQPQWEETLRLETELSFPKQMVTDYVQKVIQGDEEVVAGEGEGGAAAAAATASPYADKIKVELQCLVYDSDVLLESTTLIGIAKLAFDVSFAELLTIAQRLESTSSSTNATSTTSTAASSSSSSSSAADPSTTTSAVVFEKPAAWYPLEQATSGSLRLSFQVTATTKQTATTL